jgi:hypothetical protein
MQYCEIEREFVNWVVQLAPWDAFCTFTFELSESVEGARRKFTRWINKNWQGVPVFYVIEIHPGGHGAHIHALMRLGNKRRKEVWRDWFNSFGQARLVPIESIGACAGYCAKYCIKTAFEKGWWNVLNVSGRWQPVTMELGAAKTIVTQVL